MNPYDERRKALGYQPLVGVAAAAVVAGAGAAYGGRQQRKGAERQAQAEIQAAELQAQQDQLIADQQAAAAAEQQQTLIAAENQRRADLANSEQNLKVTDATPDVAVGGTDEDSENATGKAKARRAQFRPTYTSGVTI